MQLGQRDGRTTAMLRSETVAAAPRGIGLGVAFDWATSIELVALAVAQLAGANVAGSFGAGRQGTRLYVALLLLVLALIPFAQGEGLRRGYRWAWLIQLVANSIGAIGGLFTIPGAIASLRSGNAWPLLPTLILVLMSPWIAWRLSRPVTRAWIARADRAEARRRHDGIWLVQTFVGCAIGGILVALAVLNG